MRRGLSLIEIVVSVALLGLLVIFVITLVPTSAVTLRRAGSLQAATAYAADAVEQVRVDPSLGHDADYEVDLAGDHFHVHRQVTDAGNGLADVVVTLQDPEQHVIRMGSRVVLAPTP